jgi:hypothetical protein
VGTEKPSYKGSRFPVEIISHCVWLYHRFPLSGPPCVFRIDLIRVVRPLAADSGNRYGLPVGFGSPTLSGDVWYCSGARCSASRLCGLVRALGTRCG